MEKRDAWDHLWYTLSKASHACCSLCPRSEWGQRRSHSEAAAALHIASVLKNRAIPSGVAGARSSIFCQTFKVQSLSADAISGSAASISRLSSRDEDRVAPAVIGVGGGMKSQLELNDFYVRRVFRITHINPDLARYVYNLLTHPLQPRTCNLYTDASKRCFDINGIRQTVQDRRRIIVPLIPTASFFPTVSCFFL